MIALLLLVTASVAEPFIFDNGEVRCILFENEPVGVHQVALARWASRGVASQASKLAYDPCDGQES